MKKLLLASAISAAFAVPTAVVAQTAPAAPTLEKVLEASGISLSGYIDAAYTKSNRNLETGSSPRVFDSQNDSFALHQFGLQVAKQPKEGFGGLVNITAGKDAQVIHSFPESSTSANSLFDVTQAYGQYATGPLTVIFGKFVTLQGSEVIWTPSNVNFSHSILFGAIPFTHTGMRGTYAVNDMVSLTVGLNNGWDQLTDGNRSKTLELGATITPIKPLTIVISDYNGKDSAAVGGAQAVGAAQGTRNSLNVVATYTITDPLSVGVELLSVSQENVGVPASTAKYDGVAGYVTYMITPKIRAAARVERFNDKDGFHFATAATKFAEATLTAAYLASDSFEIRGEVRTDRANQSVFTDFDGGASKNLLTFAVQTLFKF
jgi:hypothetical protein